VREWHCECGSRVVADDGEQLIQEALLHTYEVHPEMDLTEEQVRQMIAEQASDTEDASYYVRQHVASGYSPNCLEGFFSE
jgi:hypothetical protein